MCSAFLGVPFRRVSHPHRLIRMWCFVLMAPREKSIDGSQARHRACSGGVGSLNGQVCEARHAEPCVTAYDTRVRGAGPTGKTFLRPKPKAPHPLQLIGNREGAAAASAQLTSTWQVYSTQDRNPPHVSQVNTPPPSQIRL